MIVVTGASGFIGSCLVQYLIDAGFDREVVVVDDFYKEYKEPNLEGKAIRDWVHREIFIEWLSKAKNSIQFIFHLGARTDTAEKDRKVFKKLNLDYSKEIWKICAETGIPLVYASSAATYGHGEHGFSDELQDIKVLQPLNEYAISKQEFDIWALKQKNKPPVWAGLKYFNVYGPNEYFKGRMASVVFHFYKQLKANGCIKLFRSHKNGIKDGEQARDFVYVKDVIKLTSRFMENSKFESGLYNIGTSKARTYLDLANAVIESAGVNADIEFMDTPKDIRDSYQYFSEAKLDKLNANFPNHEFYDLEAGIKDYVQKYLYRLVHI